MFSVVNVDLIDTVMSFTRSLHNGISFSKTPKKLASRFKGKNNSPLNPIQTCYFSPGQNIHTSTRRAGFLFVMLKEQFKRIVSLKMWMKFKYCGGGGWGSFVVFEASSVYSCTAVNKKQRNPTHWTSNTGTNSQYESFLLYSKLWNLKKHHMMLCSVRHSLQFLFQYLV